MAVVQLVPDDALYARLCEQQGDDLCHEGTLRLEVEPNALPEGIALLERERLS